MPPVFGPLSPSLTRLWSCAEASAIAVSPSQSAKNEASSPTRQSSMTISHAGVPRPPPNIMSIAASASCVVSATTTPFPAASPSAFTTMGAPFFRTYSLAAAAPLNRSYAAVGILLALHRSLVKPLEPSSRAALVVAKIERHAFGLPRNAGIAGSAIKPAGERTGRHLPGQRVLASAGTKDENVHRARAAFSGRSLFGVACHFTPARDSARMAEPALNNVVEWTVSELSAALKRTVEDEYGYVRVRGEISGFKGPHSSGHCYFALKDEGARLEAVIWRTAFGRMCVKPEEGLEVIVTGRLTTYPGRSSYQIVIESLEPAGIGALMKL